MKTCDRSVYAFIYRQFFSGTMIGITISMYFGLLSGEEGITIFHRESTHPGRLKVCPTN